MMTLFPMLLSIFISLSPTVFADTPDDGTRDANLETEGALSLKERRNHMQSDNVGGNIISEMSDREQREATRIRVEEVFGPLKPKPGSNGSGTSQ